MRRYLVCKDMGLSPLEYDRLDEKTVREFNAIRSEIARKEEHTRKQNG